MKNLLARAPRFDGHRVRALRGPAAPGLAPRLQRRLRNRATETALARVQRWKLKPPRQVRSPARRQATPAGLSRLPTPSEERLIAELIAETEEIRKLRFKQPVEVRVQDRTAMRRYVSRAIEQEDLVRGRRRYVALGLLDPALDVRELLESLMEEELVGYYDPKQRLLAVRDDVARSLGRHASGSDIEWRATVVHELVHALQDQHLGLGTAMDLERTTDEDNAFGALVEGDATLAMLGYVAGKAGLTLPQMVRDQAQLEASLGASPERITGALKAAPAIVREPLLFRYRTGALFAASLFQRGDWEAVNLAHTHVPVDTLTVIEPRRFPLGKAAASPPGSICPISHWLEPRGYRVVDRTCSAAWSSGSRSVCMSRVWQPCSLLARRPLCGPRARGAPACQRQRPAKPMGDASIWCLRFASVTDARQAERRLARLPDSAGVTRRVLQERPMVLVARGLPEAETRELFARFAPDSAAHVDRHAAPGRGPPLAIRWAAMDGTDDHVYIGRP